MDVFFKVYPADEPFGMIEVPQDLLSHGADLDSLAGERQPLEWDLVEGGFADYLPGAWLFPVCSSRLRELLHASAGPEDVLEWSPVLLTSETNETRPYWILRFGSVPDALDHVRTTMLGGVIGKMVLDRRGLQGHRVIPSLDGSTYSFVLAPEVKERIELEKLHGMEFRPVPVAPGT